MQGDSSEGALRNTAWKERKGSRILGEKLGCMLSGSPSAERPRELWAERSPAKLLALPEGQGTRPDPLH